ncbi:lipocalin family protein [Psychrobacter submarinus]|uniref:lipocalin family protein n=1 Tax=Psychrobacter submarinus TaxID=154108 RepID=UPI003F69CBAB
MNKYGNPMPMKANTSTKSDPYDRSYDRQANGHQVKNNHNSLASKTPAYDSYLSKSDLSKSSANSSVASNDASYAYEQDDLPTYHFSESASAPSRSGDVSCGYKKATPVAKSTLISDEEEMLLHYMQNNTQSIDNKKSSANTTEQQDALQNKQDILKHEVINTTNSEPEVDGVLDNPDLAHKQLYQNQSAINTTVKVSERVFMSSLLKHTGIALAIIIPLAAFSAYAATPEQTVTAAKNMNNTEDQTTEINIDPKNIIHKSATKPTTVDSVDLDKYAGTWYEIGRLPMYFQRNCASDVTANYTEKADGSGIIVTNKCLDKDGSQIVAEGLAKPADATGSKLKVTFLPTWIRWLPIGRADYWVLARDTDYQTALVGTPDKDYLWLLARSPNVTQQTYAKYRQIAQDQGYNLKEFTLTPHANQTVNLIP